MSFDDLLEQARKAALNSYSPYSKFRVGAAVIAGGKLYHGTNVENASYGLTICAERVAIFSAVADGHRRIEAIALSCFDAPPSSPPHFLSPCGACRQVIAEFGGNEVPVIIDGVGQMTLKDLLPMAFIL
jgi:cytidine deaminase